LGLLASPQEQEKESSQGTAAKLTPEQLDSLVAPIALYPDPLLSQTLVASTYPLEIIQLQQWLAQNKNLKEKELAEAAKKQDWDPSIQAMAALPHVVKQLAENIKDRSEMNAMTLKDQKATSTTLLISTLLFALVIPAFSPSAVFQESSTTKSTTEAQETFATSQEAVDALIKAAGDYDVQALLRIFGPTGEDFISSADPVRDKKIGLEFAELARKKHFLKAEPSNSGRELLIVGDEDWPFPVPLVKKNGRWLFDSAAGRREILYRRIGTNELDAIQVSRGFVAAQEEYASEIHDNSGVNQYAQKIMSTPGKHDGLYWKNPDGTSGGPISEAVARALSEGYSADKRSAYHGYYFKILKGQGPAAPLGRLDYVIQGVMIGGFALLAFPAEYRVTGVKTFMVSQQGIVYQKDFGPNTVEIAQRIELYNPDKAWQPTYDRWPSPITPTGWPNDSAHFLPPTHQR
jgi:hypothetical protein